VDNFSTLTHSSFSKFKASFVPEIKDPPLQEIAGVRKIKLQEDYKNIRGIHHFQQAQKFVLLISFKYNGMFSILTLAVRRRSRRQEKHIRKDFR
jgi:hypothetical protein